MALSLDEAKALRASAFAAYQNALASKSYTIGTRSKENQEIEALATEFAKWDRIVTAMECGRSDGVSMVRLEPRDL